MEPISGQRKAAFALVVLVLAALGTYLLVPAVFGTHRSGAAAGASRPAHPQAPAPASGAPAAAASPIPTATPTATPTGAAARAGQPDIYQWLPFTQPGLAAAARVVTKFGADYGTFSYTESSASYVGAMQNLVTPAVSQLLARAYAAPGVAGPRVSNKQVATGTAAIDSLRAFGASSLTFVVTMGQQITGTHGRSSVSGQYSVTVSGGSGSWQVSDIELSSAGNS
jgi:hypothetical protein